MSENKKYVVKIKGDLVEVTPEQYYAYYGEDRRERAQKEKKIRNKVMSYDALDTTDRVGLDTMRDTTTPSMDELTIQEELRSLLYQAMRIKAGPFLWLPCWQSASLPLYSLLPS